MKGLKFLMTLCSIALVVFIFLTLWKFMTVRADGVLLEILGVHDLHDPQLAPQYGQYGEQYDRRHRSDGGEDEAAGHEFPQREENEYDERYLSRASSEISGLS